MAALGQHKNPRLARYDAVRQESAMYVIDMGCAVKIGCSNTVQSRLRELHMEAERKRTGVPGIFKTFPLLRGRDTFTVERHCVYRLKELAKQIPRRREWFTGLTFDQVCAVVAEVIDQPSLQGGTQRAPLPAGQCAGGLSFSND